jgi:ribosomal protein S18 acetylase RimI-like enzyme
VDSRTVAIFGETVDGVNMGWSQIVLETEYDNAASLSLYEHLGFFREKRLYRFYSNGKDA